MSNAAQVIEAGKAVLGIEFGSTRIKAVLVDEAAKPIASGAHDWENQLENGVWTYSLDAIWGGLSDYSSSSSNSGFSDSSGHSGSGPSEILSQ